MSGLECAFRVSDGCSGDVNINELFSGQLSIPICEKHIAEHKQVMFLHKVGIDVEEIISKTSEERTQLYNEQIRQLPKAAGRLKGMIYRIEYLIKKYVLKKTYLTTEYSYPELKRCLKTKDNTQCYKATCHVTAHRFE